MPREEINGIIKNSQLIQKKAGKEKRGTSSIWKNRNQMETQPY